MTLFRVVRPESSFRGTWWFECRCFGGEVIGIFDRRPFGAEVFWSRNGSPLDRTTWMVFEWPRRSRASRRWRRNRQEAE